MTGTSQEPVLVTGADGFIGSHLVEHLVKAGFRVRALTMYNSLGSWGWLDTCSSDIVENTEVIAGDIRDADSVTAAMQGCRAVLHLAALIAIPYSYLAPHLYLETNVKGTLNVLGAARNLGIEKVVHTSTSEVYGSAQFVPITEEHPINSQSPYAATKAAADQMAMAFHYSYGLPVAIVRPFNTFGPRQSLRAVIPTIITQLLAGKEPTLNLGATYPTRDFTFVADTVRGFEAALIQESSVGEVINLGTNFEVSIEQVVNLVAEMTGRRVDVKTDQVRLRPEGSEVEQLVASNAKAKKLLGWEPLLTGLGGFRAGLELTIEWFAQPENLRRYRWDRYGI